MNGRSVSWTAPAVRDLRHLDAQIRARVEAAVLRLAESGHGDIETIKGSPGLFRLRIGDYRVLFRLEAGPPAALLVLRVRHRRDA